MTAIEYPTGTVVRPRPRFTLPMRLKRLLVQLRRHRRATSTYIALARLDEQLLYDVGLEPLDLHETLKHRLPPSMLLDAMRRQFDYDNRQGPR